MKKRLFRFTKGPKKARDALNAMAGWIEWLMAFEVDVTTGLVWEETAAGRKLGYVPQPTFFYVTVTVEAHGFGSTAAGGADFYGKGTGNLERETYDSSGNCKRVPMTKGVTFYNPGKDPIVVGRRVQVIEKAPGRLHTVSELCA